MHELIMACMFHRLRGYLLLMQVLPTPTPRLFLCVWCPDTAVDVPVTFDLYGEDEIFQAKTIIGARYVLDWYFHGTEFVEFIVFDVLRFVREGIFGYVL